MPEGKRKHKHNPRPHSFYDLSEVKRKIEEGQILIRENAREGALRDFGWEVVDILDVYKKLQPKHFYKFENSQAKSRVVVDVYKAHLNGEDVYTHFYIDDDSNKLIINSFKKI